MAGEAINIQDHHIGPGHPLFIIAEMSGNHNKSLDRAMQIVEAAAQAGADALKLQTYTPDTMTLDLAEGEFFIDDPTSLWYGNSLYELYEKAYMPWEWHKPIFDRCRELGIIGFSSAFDASAVDFLEELEVPAYKIASPENIDLPLIEKVANTGKPVMISTGMSTLEEIEEAVNTVRSVGNNQIVLLKCTSTYPATPKEMNLRTIPHLAQTFNLPVGLSDHSLCMAVPIAAVALGCCIIEKHLTLSRSVQSTDSVFSLEPDEFRSMVEAIRTTEDALGDVCYEAVERENRLSKRSLFVVRNIKAGETFTKENIRSIRPGHGLHPKYYNQIIGSKAVSDIAKGTPLRWDIIERK